MAIAYIAYGTKEAIVAELGACDADCFGGPYYVFPVGDELYDPSGEATIKDAKKVARLFADGAGNVPVVHIG